MIERIVVSQPNVRVVMNGMIHEGKWWGRGDVEEVKGMWVSSVPMSWCAEMMMVP